MIDDDNDMLCAIARQMCTLIFVVDIAFELRVLLFAYVFITEKQELLSSREVVNTGNADLLRRLRQLEELNELLMQRLRYVKCLVWDMKSLVQKMTCAMFTKNTC